MKKTLAVLLSVLMVISTITCAFTVTVAQAETISGELLSNGDFEDLAKNPVGAKMGAVRGVKVDTLLNGKWRRATEGLDYATLGDLIDYNEETDEVTKAAATDYAKYFAPVSTVIAQPDDQANHIGRMNQTMFQAIDFNSDEGTFVYKMKVRGTEANTKFLLGFSGLITEDGEKPIDSFYQKYNLTVVKSSGDFTYTLPTGASAGKIYVTLTNPTEWTDMELVIKATKNKDYTLNSDTRSVLDIDFTMFHLYHDSATLKSGAANGNNYRKQGLYVDDISLKTYANPFGAGEFYKNGEKIENTNEYGGAKCTVNGKETLGLSVGDTVVATPDYNEDANVFVGWFKGDELITREKEISFTVNSTDVYTPKFINKNLLEGTAASFESYENNTSLVVKDNTKYPEAGEWGANKNAGYYGVTYEEIIYDRYGNAYQQVASGSPEALTVSTIKTTQGVAYKGASSLYIKPDSRVSSTGLDVVPNTNYTLTCYVLAKGATSTIKHIGVATTLNMKQGYQAAPISEGYTLYCDALGNLPNGICLAKQSAIVSDGENWQKLTFTFNSGNFEKLYFVLAPTPGSEEYWIDELCLTAEEKPGETPAVKYVDSDGVFLDAAKTQNIYAKTFATEDFDGSYLLDLDYEDESGAYTFIGWYDADNNLLSKEVNYDYEGEIANVFAKILSRNILDGSASFESYENNTSFMVSDITKYPNVNEWGANFAAGYHKVTYEEVIYDKYGYAYQQTSSGDTVVKQGVAKAVNTKAYKGNNSLYVNGSWAAMSTGLEVEPNTNYTLTYFVQTTVPENVMKYDGIATTLNVANGVTPTALDGGTLATAMASGIGNMGVGYSISRHQNLEISGTEWTKVTHAFNSGNFTKLYFCICPTGADAYYVDELSLVAEEKPETVDVKIVNDDGTDVADDVAANAVVSATVEKDIYTGTKTAIVNYETGAYTFLGWYDADDTLVSTDKEFVVTGSLDGVYAKVQNNNLLTYAGSYETYDNNLSLKYTGTDYPSGIYFGGNKNDGYLGQTFEETIYDNKGNAIEQTAGGTFASNNVNAIISNAKAHSGNKSIELKNGWWTASMSIEVEPNTDYALSYWILAPKQEGLQNTIALSAIATTVNTGAKGSGSTAPLNQATNLYLDSKALTTVHDGENWIKVTHSFNSMNLNKVYLVIGQTVYSATGNINSWAYIDDMTMIETKPTTISIDMKSCASIAPIDADLNALYFNQEFTFKVIDNMDTDAVVTFNGETVTPNADGIYTIYLGEENALSVRFAGDENLLNYDEDEFGRKLNVNNLDVYSEAVWEGDTVYHETALFTPDKDTVKLLYPVDQIVSLRSYDLTQNYIEGYDFEITEDGMIKRLDGGRIPVWANSLTTDTEGDWKTNDGKYVVLTGDQTYPKYAISVTYKHSTTFADGYTPETPESQYAYLNNVMAKLENGEEVNVVVYGDSISCGWSSSSMNPDIKIYDDTNTEGNYITRYNINVAPFAPTWIQMLEAKLKEMYPDATINFKNLSLGGKSAPWGAENIEDRLALWKDEEGNQVVPDLILTGFGVNDCNNYINRVNNGTAGTIEQEVAAFKNNMKAIVDNAREATGNANMEALFYSPMFPNQNAIYWPAEVLLAYENAMVEIAEYDNNIGVLKLSSIFNEIIKNKDAEDYLNTNLNHGNDFTARLYYTGILAAMKKDSNVVVGIEGDANGDEVVNLKDLVILAQFAANWEVDINKKVADLNNDGKVDLEDVNYLARHLAGWEDSPLV